MKSRDSAAGCGLSFFETEHHMSGLTFLLVVFVSGTAVRRPPAGPQDHLTPGHSRDPHLGRLYTFTFHDRAVREWVG